MEQKDTEKTVQDEELDQAVQDKAAPVESKPEKADKEEKN